MLRASRDLGLDAALNGQDIGQQPGLARALHGRRMTAMRGSESNVFEV